MPDKTKRISYSYGESSTVGKANEGGTNEDSQSSYVPPSLKLPGAEIKGVFCIADGFGGPGLGDAASRETVKLVNEVFVTGEYVKWAQSRGIESKDLLKVLRAAVYQINYVISGYATKHDRRMGTTLDVLIFKDHRFYLAHVGNSRIYLMRNGIVYRLTQDHAVDMEMAKPDARINLLGIAPEVSVDVFSDEVQPGDSFILCTDGLTESVSEEEIKYALVHNRSPQGAAEKLVRLADKRDGSDNITVTMISTVHPGRELQPPAERKPLMPKVEAKRRQPTRRKLAKEKPEHVAKEKPEHPKRRKPLWQRLPSRELMQKKTVLIPAITVIAAVVIMAIVLTFSRSPSTGFSAVYDQADESVALLIENIGRDEQYYVYRQEGRAFEPKSDKLPRTPEAMGPFSLEDPELVDDMVEGGKTYYYTAYRVITAAIETKLDLKSIMIAGPVVIGRGAIAATEKDKGDEAETAADDQEKFREIYDRHMALKRDYEGSLSEEQKDDILETIRDYKDKIKEIDQLDRQLVLLESRKDLSIDSTTPSNLKGSFAQLKDSMYKTVADEGLVLYLKRLRQKALRTDFVDVPSREIASLLAEMSDTPWRSLKPELNVLVNLTYINREIQRDFVPPRTVVHSVDRAGQPLMEVLEKFFSEKKLKSTELVERIYEINRGLTPGEPLSAGTKVLVPEPEFERGGDKLSKLQDELIGDPSPYYHAINSAIEIEDEELRKEYKELAELFRIKVLLWYAVNQNSRRLDKEILDIDTVRSADIDLYKDSFVRQKVQAKLDELRGVEVAVEKSTIEKQKAATEELERLGKIFHTIDPEDEAEVFLKGVADFEKLKGWVMAEEHPDFDTIKELLLSQEAALKSITETISRKEDVLIEKADKLVKEVGEVSRLTGDYDSAASKLREAASLYEDAISLMESEEEKEVLRQKITTVNDKIGLIQARTVSSDIREARWNREITELSLSEVLVYLCKLTELDDEIVVSYKQKYPEAYSTEVKATVKRIKELDELSTNRIIRRLDPAGPTFDETNFRKGITEFKLLSFALTAIVEDEKICSEFEQCVTNLSECVKDGILHNHLRYPGADRAFRRSILTALDSANTDINDRFGDKIEHDKLRAKIIDNKGNTYVDSVRVFAASIGQRLQKYPLGPRKSYYVEVLLPPDEESALTVARTLWDDSYPLLRLRLSAGNRYIRAKNYQLVVGWYRIKEEAEEASSAIQREPLVFQHIISVSVREQISY